MLVFEYLSIMSKNGGASYTVLRTLGFLYEITKLSTISRSWKASQYRFGALN